jgi:hypothetical protein
MIWKNKEEIFLNVFRVIQNDTLPEGLLFVEQEKLAKDGSRWYM